MSQTEARDVRIAHGGIAEVYQAAYRQFAQSDALQGEWEPAPMERMLWLKDMIQQLQKLHVVHLHLNRDRKLAVQSRRALGAYLDELGALLQPTEGEPDR